MLGLPETTEISRPLPKKTLFAKFEMKPSQRDHFDEDISLQIAIYHTKLITSRWQKENEAVIRLQGLNLDRVWKNLVAEIGNIIVEDGNTLEQQIAIDDERVRRLKAIADLERKARAEKQPRKRLELFEEIKKLKA